MDDARPRFLELGEGPSPVMPAEVSPESEQAELKLGEVAHGFDSLPAVDGSSYSFESFRSHRVLVLAFLGDACPAVKACIGELVDLQRRFAADGVQVVGINPNNPFLSPTDTLERMVPWAQEFAVNFPYLKDVSGRVARAFGAKNSPHFLVLDADRRLRYRGRMFDSRQPERATRRDVEEVVRHLVDGRPVEPTETMPLGCSIVW